MASINMSSKKIIIKASDFPVTTGNKDFKDVKKKCIDYILNRNNIKNMYLPKNNLESHLLTLEKQNPIEFKKTLNEFGVDNIDGYLKKIKEITNECLCNKLLEKESRKMLDKKLKDLPVNIKKCIEQDTRIERGNKKENLNINKHEIKNKIKIGNRNDKYYQKEICEFEHNKKKYKLELVGMVDGICDDNANKFIFESKSRRNRLFGKIPNWEKPQLYAYMFLTDIKKSKLSENYNDEEKSYFCNFETKVWNNYIEKTKSFIINEILMHYE